MVDEIKLWYDWGFWTATMVMEAVPALITQEQATMIVEGG